MEITYKNLSIDFPYELESIEDISFQANYTEHPYLFLKAVIPEENGDEYVHRITNETEISVKWKKDKDSKHKVIFNGLISSVKVTYQGGLHILYLYAQPYSAQMDKEKKSRSFFKKGVTYGEIIKAVLKDYPKASIVAHVDLTRKVDFPIIQYKETDWKFIKRIASLFEAVAVPDYTSKNPRIHIGYSKQEVPVPVNGMTLETGKNLEACLIDYNKQFTSISLLEDEETDYADEKAMQKQFLMHELDYVNLSVTDIEYYPLGTLIDLNGIRLVITKVELYVYKETLLYDYTLQAPSSIRTRYEGNPAISGVSLIGKVKERKGNNISIRLEIDEDDGFVDNREDYFFTYALETSAYYCMPVVGARVHLYFPSDREWEAIAVNSLRCTTEGAKRQETTSNPSNKSLSTENGQALELTPAHILLKADDDNITHIKLSKDGNIDVKGKNFLLCSKNINIGKTEESVSTDGTGVPALICKELKLKADNALVLGKCEVGEESVSPLEDYYIGLADLAQLFSPGKIYHETTGGRVPPCVSYDEGELRKEEEEQKDKNNKAVTDALIARKKESKGKFFKGLAMGCLGALAVGVCLATGGAAIGAVLGVGAMIFAEYEMAEGVSGYNLAMSGDLSTEASNPLKEFMGEPLYTMVKTGFSIGSSIYFTFTMAAFTGVKAVFDVAKGIKAVKGMLAGSSLMTGIPMIFDVLSNGKLDRSFTDYMDDFSFNAMTIAMTGPAFSKLMKCGDQLRTLDKLRNMTVKFGQQMATSTMLDAGRGEFNLGENLFREAISSFTSGWVNTRWLSNAIDITMDGVAELGVQAYKVYTKQQDGIDYKQLATTLVTSAVMNVFFGADPVDTVRGRLFIYHQDLIEEDLYGEFILARRYSSLCDGKLTMGKGWLHEYEGYLIGDDSEVSVVCYDTHKEVFLKQNGQWINKKEGNQCYILKQDMEKERFYFTSYEGGKYRQEEYDFNGQLLSIAYHPTSPRKTVLRYQESGLLDTVTTPGGKVLTFYYEGMKLSKVMDSFGRKVTYEYEGDYLTKVYYPDGGIHTFHYDENGFLNYADSPNGKQLMRNEYDREGRIIKQIYPDDNYCSIEYQTDQKETIFYYSSNDRKEIYRYDRTEQVTEILYDDGTSQFYEYDQRGNTISYTDRLGNQRESLYDSSGNLLQEKTSSGLIISYTYNNYNKVIQKEDSQGGKNEYVYDDRQNLIEEKVYLGDGKYKTTNYTYDRAGRITSITDSNSNKTAYLYEGEKTRGPHIYNTPEGNEFRYEYDKAGRNTAIHSEYGTVEYTYNSFNEKTLIIDGLGNATRKVFDKNNNVIKLIPPNLYNEKTGLGDGYRYYYDYMDRLEKTVSPTGIVYVTQLDGAGNVIKVVNPETYDPAARDGIGYEYAYDKYKNQIRETNP